MVKRNGKVLYDCLCASILNKCHNHVGCIVDHKFLFTIAGREYHVPKEKRFEMLDELVAFGFVSKVGRGKNGILYKVLG